MLIRQPVVAGAVRIGGERRARWRLGGFAVAFSVIATALGVGAVQPVSAAPSEPTEFIVNGTGFGHGRGLSQWGAYGRAVNGGQSWSTILDAYYGGTTSANASNSELGVRLLGSDGAAVVSVISPVKRLRWAGSSQSASQDYASVYAIETSDNKFDIFAMTSELGCANNVVLPLPTGTFSVGSPTSEDVRQVQAFLNAYGFNAGPADGIFGPTTKGAVERFQGDRALPINGVWSTAERTAALALMDRAPSGAWQRVADAVSGPITFSSRATPADVAPADTLGLCGGPNGIVHYRGELEAIDTTVGNRVVNRVSVESYLRGVVPREVSPSWGKTAAGMNALKAQAVAARSYALSQDRYSYAETCDSASCQVYGGAAVRATPTSTASTREHPNTDSAVAATAGVVRKWPDGSIVATEFSASNGPRTAGGNFPAVDDPFDDVEGNKYHTWTRTLTAAQIANAFELSSLAGVKTEPDPGSSYDGIWANRVRLDAGSTVSAWVFRTKLDLPSPGFTIKPVFPGTTGGCLPAASNTFAMIGDSVGVQVAGTATSPLPVNLNGAFASTSYDVLDSRATKNGTVPDGVTAVGRVPTGTEIVLVELGYNDAPGEFGARVDDLLAALKGKSVGKVLWVNLSERRSEFAETNRVLQDAARRYPNLEVLDWQAASKAHDSWFVDGVHLTGEGSRAFASFLTGAIGRAAGVESGACLAWQTPRVRAGGMVRVPVLGSGGIPNSLAEVKGVALNVTAVNPGGSTHLKVWECGSAQPETSSVNYEKGNDTPNAVILPLSRTGDVCVWSMSATDVIVDVSGWFDADSGLRVATGRLLDSRPNNRVAANEVVRVPLRGKIGIPNSSSQVQAVSLNVVAVQASTFGHLTVWECGETEPSTSSVNFEKRSDAANAVVVPLRGSGEACIRPSTATDIVVDVTGWFDSEADIHPIEKRLHDSRVAGGRLAAQTQRGVANSPEVTIDGGAVTGVIYNVTAVQPDGYGHLRVWPCGPEKPPTSAVNYRPNINVPNAVILAIGSQDSICVWTVNNTDLVIDAVAAFGAGSGLHSAAARMIDTREIAS